MAKILLVIPPYSGRSLFEKIMLSSGKNFEDYDSNKLRHGIPSIHEGYYISSRCDVDYAMNHVLFDEIRLVIPEFMSHNIYVNDPLDPNRNINVNENWKTYFNERLASSDVRLSIVSLVNLSSLYDYCHSL